MKTCAPILWPFGQNLPFVPKSPALAETSAGLHFVLMLVLVGALVLHIVGALKHHDGFGELKSMRAHPDARGIGAGKAMLVHLIARARELDFASVKLETGSGELFETAVGLYNSFGFEPCGKFADYEPGDFNKLYSLDL